MSAFGGILDMMQWILRGGASSGQRIQEANIARNKRQAEREMTLIEQLRTWEARLSTDEMSRAIGVVTAAGWKTGDQPPAYVWAEAYRRVAPDKMPTPQNSIGFGEKQ